MNGAHVVGPPFGKGFFHPVAQNIAIGQSGQGIKACQVVDFGLGNPAFGDVLYQNDHAAVFHRLDREFERSPIHHVHSEGGVVASRKLGVRRSIRLCALSADSRPALTTPSTKSRTVEPFSSKSIDSPTCWFSF